MESLLAGLVLGLGSGVAPGPLLALTLSTALGRGTAAGLQVAASPLLTDTVVIAVCLAIAGQVPPTALAALSIVGGLVIAWFGWEALREARSATVSRLADGPAATSGPAPRLGSPLLQGVALNLLSPAPWLFWATAGSAALVTFWRDSPASAVVFVAAFYVALVGSKAMLAVAVARGRHRLSDRGYRALATGAGLLLLVFAAVYLVSGAQALR